MKTGSIGEIVDWLFLKIKWFQTQIPVKNTLKILNQNFQNEDLFQNFFTSLFLALFGQELLKSNNLHFISLILAFNGHEVK